MKNNSGTKKRKRKFTWDDQLPEESHLPTELLLEVLARLPVKTLLKFRCVCKFWCQIIDSSDFIYMHLKLFNYQSSENTRVLGREECGRHTQFTIRRSDSCRKSADLVRIPRSYEILGNINGLILMMNYPDIVLWNPSIRKALILPTSPFESGSSRLVYTHYVLGFSPSSNDYKVLDFRRGYSGSMSISFAIYSLNDHLWRIKPDWTNVWDLPSSLSPIGRGSVNCRGVLYWIGHNTRLGQETHHLFFVDFEVEKFSVMQLPEAAKESAVKCLFLLGESLAIFAMSSESSIWVMEKVVGEDPWRLWFLGDPDLDVCKLFKPVTTRYLFSKILYVQKSNAFLMVEEKTERDRKRGYRVISYDIRSHQLRELKKPIRNRIYLNTYVESLVMHKGFEGRTLTSFP